MKGKREMRLERTLSLFALPIFLERRVHRGET